MGVCVLAGNVLYGVFNETHFCGKASAWRTWAFTRTVKQKLKRDSKTMCPL